MDLRLYVCFWALNTEQGYGFRNVLFLRTEKIVPFIISYGTFHPRHRTPLQRRCRNNRSHQADNDTLMKILPLRTPSCVQGLINGLYVRGNRACQLKSRQQYVLPFLRPSCVQGLLPFRLGALVAVFMDMDGSDSRMASFSTDVSGDVRSAELARSCGHGGRIAVIPLASLYQDLSERGWSCRETGLSNESELVDAVHATARDLGVVIEGRRGLYVERLVSLEEDKAPARSLTECTVRA